MSLLIDLAGQLAPHFSFFASRVAEGALQRASDRTVDAGEDLFRGLVRRDAPADDGRAALPPGTADELVRGFEGLGPADRARLVEALRIWLDGADDGQADLVALVGGRQPAPAPSPAAPAITMTSTGDNNTLIGHIDRIENVNPAPRADRP
ncbi:hypothetical protein [Streptomyces sp. NPDC001478]